LKILLQKGLDADADAGYKFAPLQGPEGRSEKRSGSEKKDKK
jgi:hypothetical protein